MPGGQYYTFKSLRPPVAVDNLGQSPLKSGLQLKNRRRTLADPQNRQILEKLNDDGQLIREGWSPNF